MKWIATGLALLMVTAGTPAFSEIGTAPPLSTYQLDHSRKMIRPSHQALCGLLHPVLLKMKNKQSALHHMK